MMKQPILISRRDIEIGLQEMGLKTGDIVILHSSLSSLGTVKGGAETVVDAFLNVLGENGTLVVPVFGSLGVIPEAVKRRPGAVQSVHPKAGVAAIGPAASELCADHWKAELAHGPGTPYMRLAEKGGYVCMLGVDLDRCTLLHTPEELLRLPYLRPTEETTFDTPEGLQTKSWPFFPGPHRDFIGLDRLFRASGKMRTRRIGNAVVRLIRAADMIEIARRTAEGAPDFALCRNPNCADCVAQRAALRHARFSQLPFDVCASAMLAGRCIDEIVANCRDAGIPRVEMDGLRCRPLLMHPPAEIHRAIETLRAEGLTISALRFSAASEKMAEYIRLARDAGISRVVVPLSDQAPAHAALAADAGRRISFFNICEDSAGVSTMLLRLRDQGFDPAFVFNAANFARAGENPFLRSYKAKLRRFVDQLDLEDCLYDGTPQALAFGNGEIREMVSILSAASFDGYMVIGAANRPFGTLLDAAVRFEDILNSI